MVKQDVCFNFGSFLTCNSSDALEVWWDLWWLFHYAFTIESDSEIGQHLAKLWARV